MYALVFPGYPVYNAKKTHTDGMAIGMVAVLGARMQWGEIGRLVPYRYFRHQIVGFLLKFGWDRILGRHN